MQNINLGDDVTIVCSQEVAKVVGIANYLEGKMQYLLRYKNGLGVAVEQWWSSDAIKLVSA